MSKITKLEQDIDSEEKFDEYEKTKNELEKIYDDIAEGVKIRSKCSLYKIFLRLGKEKCIAWNY